MDTSSRIPSLKKAGDDAKRARPAPSPPSLVPAQQPEPDLLLDVVAQNALQASQLFEPEGELTKVSRKPTKAEHALFLMKEVAAKHGITLRELGKTELDTIPGYSNKYLYSVRSNRNRPKRKPGPAPARDVADLAVAIKQAIGDASIDDFTAADLARKVSMNEWTYRRHHEKVLDEFKLMALDGRDFWSDEDAELATGLQLTRQLIHLATTALYIITFEWTHPELVDDVIAALARKVDVRIFVDYRSMWHKNSADVFTRLIDAGVPVYIRQDSKTVHAKLIIVNRSLIMVGSGNLSRRSLGELIDVTDIYQLLKVFFPDALDEITEPESKPGNSMEYGEIHYNPPRARSICEYVEEKINELVRDPEKVQAGFTRS